MRWNPTSIGWTDLCGSRKREEATSATFNLPIVEYFTPILFMVADVHFRDRKQIGGQRLDPALIRKATLFGS
jgi:hypothetical protein